MNGWPRIVLAPLCAVLLMTLGCSSTRTIHWNRGFDSAARALDTLSAERTGKVVTEFYDTIPARSIVLRRDSLLWNDPAAGTSRALRLGEVEEVRVDLGGRALRGAVYTGLATSLLFWSAQPALSAVGGILVVAGMPAALAGGLIGHGSRRWVVFVR